MTTDDAASKGSAPAVVRAEDVPETPQHAQRALMVRTFDSGADQPRTVVEGRSRTTESGADFLFEEGTILVREEHFEKVRAILEELYLFPVDEDQRPEPVVVGIRLVHLRTDVNPELGTIRTLGLIRDGGKVRINLPPPEETRPGDEVSAAQQAAPADEVSAADEAGAAVVRRLTRTIAGIGAGAVSAHHVVPICGPTGNGGGCPAVEPEPMPAGSAPYPGYTADRCAGEGVKVVVVDTGLDRKATRRSSWLKGVRGDRDYAIQGSTLNEYAGHGTFIAGVIRCIAPLAEVCVRQVFGFGGAALERDLVQRLDDILEEDHPDIISMSAGTYTYDASGLLTFPAFSERLSHHKGVVLVVAAGNDGDRKPFWPAAAPYTVSVGALGTHWRGRAGFSNYGGWVDVYAPGQDLVNAFPKGTYTYREPPHVVAGQPPRVVEFYGMARWSGTSFSTPVVAGLIAARMSRTGENGREAAAALIAEAQGAAQPGVGAVLLPE
jgi:subtilisin family serine protease